LSSKWILLTMLLAPVAVGQQITGYSSGNLAIGQTTQLTAYVPLVVNTVNWSVNGRKFHLWHGLADGRVHRAHGGANEQRRHGAGNQHRGFHQVRRGDHHNHAARRATLEHFADCRAGRAIHDFSQWRELRINSVVQFGNTPLSTTLVSSTGLQATGAATPPK